MKDEAKLTFVPGSELHRTPLLIMMLSSQLRCATVVSSNLISLEVVLNMITTDGMKIEIGFLSCKDGCDNLSGLFLDGGEAGFRDAHWSYS
jgi:hypothetical protein